MLRALILASVLLSPVARAQTVDELRAEVEERVARNNWQAADRAFRELADQAKPTAHDLFLAGQAARALGDVNVARDRFEQAVRQDKDRAEYADELDALLGRYGEVKLGVPGSHSGGVPLRASAPVIDSELRLVIEHAKKALTNEHKYSGLLPLGSYTLGAASFEVSTEHTAKAKLE